MPKEPKALTPAGIQAYAKIQQKQEVVDEVQRELALVTEARDDAILEAIDAGVPVERAGKAAGLGRTFAYHIINKRKGA